ncbi:gliding motility lipoprotein GldH [Mucilaginibacter limnophilus]|uniref:Gliding motility lipoprotein GldH n=1 Tax=Mucilaginibacter limnophilus TaxID=1932778 RepID=A0A437MUL9_9SPHI|nr:gliding motility lipoprotein GldH [Mucilaginibacter limnophilus]RVU01306.1 gliding motility lipoprotein GldH [Mucilaginibacter limnophilus]
MRYSGIYLSMILALLLGGCANPNTIIDDNKEIPNHNWAYVNRAAYDVQIDDPNSLYNIYCNLRITADYKYSNIFIIFRRGEHGKKPQATRYEFKLANPDGEWLGAGSGNVYSYRFKLLTNYKLPAKGKYHFELEQNMRDNPLKGVSDAGITIEKVK